MKSSTRNLLSLAGKNLYLKIDGYLYLKYISQYVGSIARAFYVVEKVVNKSNAFIFLPLIRFLTSRYHGKVMLLQDAHKIIRLNENVSVPENVAKSIIPYEKAYDIIIQNPESIVAVTCSCRKAKGHNCEPSHKCMIIGEPFSSFILEHNKTADPVKLTQKEAIDLLTTCKNNGFVSNAYCKDGVGNRMYAICNCCPVCCVSISAVQLFRSLGIKERSLAQSGYLPEINLEKCSGMGHCVKACPFGAMKWRDEAKKIPFVDTNLCMGCGTCSHLCPEKAILMKTAPEKGVALDMDNLAASRG